MQRPTPSELILTPEGRIYHLRLKPGEVADNVILVGDPQRVNVVSSFFDKIEYRSQNREIATHTGYIGSKRISVISTGMGPDNIDIVVNELDALFNLDLGTGKPLGSSTPLNIVRIGTSGAIQKDIPVNSFVVSSHGVGLDGLVYFYKGAETLIDKEMTRAFISHLDWPEELARPYIIEGSDKLIRKIGEGLRQDITVTSPGFYGPQGRSLRLPLAHPEINEKLSLFEFGGRKIANYEMETAALYGLGKMLGHNTATACLILANRTTGEYSSDYDKYIRELIKHVLEKLTT